MGLSVLKKRDQIISMVRQHSAQYLKRTHEFEFKLPKTVKEDYAIDKMNGYTLWQEVIWNEMENVKIIFQTIPKGKKPPGGF